jgi:hypothetical protein
VRICIHKKVVHATKSSRHNLFVRTYQIWVALTRARHKSVKNAGKTIKGAFRLNTRRRLPFLLPLGSFDRAFFSQDGLFHQRRVGAADK